MTHIEGLLLYIRIMRGSVKPGDKIRMMATGKEFEVLETGVFTPNDITTWMN